MKKEKIMKVLKKLFDSRKKTFIVVVLLFLAIFIIWRSLGGKKQEPRLQTAPVERGMIVSSVSVSGQVLIANIAEVTSKASGLVEKLYVSDGDWIAAGQKIMKIRLDQGGKQNKAQAYSSYLSAKNSLESAKATQYSLQATMFDKWDTFRELAESDSYDTPEERALPEFHIPEKEWLAAEAKYKNQQAVISQGQAAVNNAWLSYQTTSSEITAPVSGTITGFAFAEGMTIGSQSTTTGTRTSQRVAAIKSEGTPMASFNLSEIDVSQVSAGQKATITLDSMADKTFTGKVVSVDRVGMVISGVTNYPVIIQLDTGSDQILPNMTATAEIIIEAKENVLWVPPQAISTQAGQTTVRVLIKGRPQERQVEVGLETSSQAEIVSGLSEGETIIVSEIIPAGEMPGFGGAGFRGIMPGMGGRPR